MARQPVRVVVYARQPVGDPNVYAFAAYAWMGRDRPDLKDANPRWRGRAVATAFECEPDGKEAWLTKWKDPATLVGEGTLTRQADALSAWIVSVFRELPVPDA
jgi:hypothetical protein